MGKFLVGFALGFVFSQVIAARFPAAASFIISPSGFLPTQAPGALPGSVGITVTTPSGAVTIPTS